MNAYELYIKKQFSLFYYNPTTFTFNVKGTSSFLPINLKFSYYNNSIEITPSTLLLLLKHTQSNKYTDKLNFSEECDFYIPLYSNNKIDPIEIKSLTKIFNKSIESNELLTFKFKDYIYYYGDNILLDSNFNILFLITYKANKVQYEKSPCLNLEITDIIFRINPIVWRTEDSISKIIKLKLFNYWISNNIDFISIAHGYNILFSNPKVNKKLYIEDPNFFITNIKAPDYLFSNSNINKYLLDNINLL